MPSNNIKDIEFIRSHFNQRYYVAERAGEGGMSLVYKAKHKLTGRTVAIKVLKPELYTDKNILDRFYQEIKIGATLSHPNLLKISYGENYNGLHFLEMEYLKGKSLHNYIYKKGPLKEQKTISLILPIISALSYLHHGQIIHRDIKSSNIFITNQNRPVLMDFGVAWQQNGNIVNSLDKLVTVEYSSPEDLSGILFPDQRSDLYSIGVVMFECLTGRLPFKRNTITSTIKDVIEKHPPNIAELNHRVSEKMLYIIMKLLEKKPANRFQSASDLWHELKKLEKSGFTISIEDLIGVRKREKRIQLPYMLESVNEEKNNFPSFKIVGREIESQKYLCVIGRATPKGIIPDIDIQNNTVSRQHCEIICTSEWVGIRHLYSENPTFINRVKLVSGEIYPIQHNDLLSVGCVNFIFKTMQQ